MRSKLLALNPAWYHGRGRRAPYFEGWYYKLVDASEQLRYAIIPGVSLSRGDEPSHCFVQVLDGTTGRATYHTYPIGEFWAARDRLDVRVGPNSFRLDRIMLDIHDDQRTLTGEVSWEIPQPWPVTLTSPGIMGWFAWVPLMQCYHGVLGFDHALRGTLTADGQTLDWEGGRGYIEKDWGRSFPSAWIWLQSNHFSQPGSCLTVSVATIPWLGRSFRGLIAGLWHHGRLHRLATYTGARLTALESGSEHLHLELCDRRYRLEIDAERTHVGVLRGPSGADMGLRVPETMLGRVTARLWELRPVARLLFEDTGRNAGIEVVGTL